MANVKPLVIDPSGQIKQIQSGEDLVDGDGNPIPIVMPTQSHMNAYMNGTQAIAQNTVTTVVFNSEQNDVQGEYDHTTGFFTAAEDGVYNVQFGLEWANTSASLFDARIALNGGSVFRNYNNNDGAKTWHPQTGGTSIRADAGDTIRIQVFTNMSGAVLGLAASNWGWLSIAKVA